MGGCFKVSYKLLSGVLAYLGLPAAAAAALAVLIVEGVPMGLSEISRRTGYSKGHLSVYLRTLSSRGLVERINVGRRTYYKSSPNTLIRIFEQQLCRLRSSIEAASRSIKDSTYSARLQEISRSLQEIIRNGGGK
jgi:DNA-binding transcriptional regulator GbsR (MarR family)